jgi:hypothetical protein
MNDVLFLFFFDACGEFRLEIDIEVLTIRIGQSLSLTTWSGELRSIQTGLTEARRLIVQETL